MEDVGNLRKEGDRMARMSVIILVAVMIMLFAVVFAVLGKGEYEPPAPEGAMISVRI